MSKRKKYSKEFKLDAISLVRDQNISGKAKNITVSKKGRHWFVSIQVEQEIKTPVHTSKSTSVFLLKERYTKKSFVFHPVSGHTSPVSPFLDEYRKSENNVASDFVF